MNEQNNIIDGAATNMFDDNLGKYIADSTKTTKRISKTLTATTRYIASLAYRDRKFSSRVIDEVIEQKYKTIAPSYGVNLATILKHCLNARRKNIIRDILVLATLAIPLLSENFIENFVYALEHDPSLFLSFVEHYSRPLIISLMLAFLIVFIDRFITEHVILTKFFSKNAFSQDKNHQRASKKNISLSENSNVVIYGSFSPFVGSGIDLGGWSFSIDIKKGKEQLGNIEKPKPFYIRILYEFLENELNGLDLEGLAVEDKLFVDGRTLRENRRFLPNVFSRPINQLEPDALKEYVGYSANNIRHYKQIQVIDWDGEIVITIFLRFIKTKDHLFTEANYFLLPPLGKDCYKLDELQPLLTLQRFNEILFTSVAITPFIWAASPFLVVFHSYRPILAWQSRRATRKLIKRNPLFNYGATTSVRELASSTLYRVFFQKLDKDMHLKIIEKKILDLIIKFLDNQDIDTSELRDRQKAILNYGVIVSGGSIKAESLAVGEKAKAAVNWGESGSVKQGG